MLTVAVSAAARGEEQPLPAANAASQAPLDFFEKKVRPILVARCHQCHGPKVQKGNLRLDSRESIVAGGDTGPAIVPGNPDDSLLVGAVRYGDVYQMPPKSQLPASEIETLVQWVRLGAPWPAENASTQQPARREFNLAERATHWCFQPLVEAAIPPVSNPAWPRNAIDHFVLSRLEAAGIEPVMPADKRTLLRRVTYDLIGLPPTRDEVASFLADEAPDAYERVVGRLLTSAHYGERWARHWLDLVRFAETHGHEFDFPIPNAFRYRDYIIRALNDDLPYDQFVLEHLAGDLLQPPRTNPAERINESVLGTGFFWFGEAKHSPVDVRQDEADRIDNQIDVLAKTFLALTVSCARCHDHKFDAITTKDYYALSGYLQSSRYQQAFIDLPEVFAPSLAELSQLAADEAELVPGLLRELAAAPTLLDLLFTLITGNDKLKQAAGNPSHPLHTYAILSNAASESPERFTSEKQRLVAQFKEAQAPASAPAGNMLADFRTENYPSWCATGQAFSDRPGALGQFACLSEAGAVRCRILPARAAHSGLVSTKLRGVLRSPTFSIDKPRILYRLWGTGGRVRLILDGLQLIQNPIYGGLQFEPPAELPAWHVQDVSKWIGHKAYVEIVDDSDGYVAVEQIVQSDGDVPAPPLDHAFADLIADPAITSLDALKARCLAEVRAALDSAAAQSGEHGVKNGNYSDLLSCLLAGIPELANAQASESPALAELAALAKRRQEIESRIPIPRMAPALADGTGENESVFIRGNPKNLGDEVGRRSLEVLSGAIQPSPSCGSGRLELAQRWIKESTHLLARVIVNRIWKHHFGDGIVPTADDFGAMGQLPLNPPLLDHLALDFIRHDWSIKHLHRTILLSSAYRMSSRSTESADAQDPQNKLLHRMPIRRLEAECIRDALLAVSGRLNPAMYGESVAPYLTDFMIGRGRPDRSGPVDADGRRSIYISVRRNFLTPMLLAFDYPTPFTTIGRRGVSNVPAQALTLLNNPFVRDQAEHWARRMSNSSFADDDQRVTVMYETAFGRPPDSVELAAAHQFLTDSVQTHSTGSEAWRPLAELAHVLFNVKEFIFIK